MSLLPVWKMFAHSGCSQPSVDQVGDRAAVGEERVERQPRVRPLGLGVQVGVEELRDPVVADHRGALGVVAVLADQPLVDGEDVELARWGGRRVHRGEAPGCAAASAPASPSASAVRSSLAQRRHRVAGARDAPARRSRAVSANGSEQVDDLGGSAGPVRRVLLQAAGRPPRPVASGTSPRSDRTGVGCLLDVLVQHLVLDLRRRTAARRRASRTARSRGRTGRRRRSPCAGAPARVPCTWRCRRSRPSWSGGRRPRRRGSGPTPKSSTFTTPSAASITLDGLRSRWTTPARCAASRPLAICAPIAAAHATGSWPLSASASSVSRVIPSMYSIAR